MRFGIKYIINSKKGVSFMPKRKRVRSNAANEDEFLNSLENLAPEDISQEDAPKAKLDFGEILRRAVMLACAAVFVYSGAIMLDRLTSKVRANVAYDDIRDIFYDESGVSVDGTLLISAQSATISPITGNVYEDSGDDNIDDQFLIRSKLKSLESINSDIYGWIKIDGTRIDYPVVQGADNEYYLHYNFKKEYMYSGTLFVDAANSKQLLENRNTVIYGHNMTDGSMFHTLFNFKDKQFFANGLVEITTDDGLYIYEIFSAHVVNEADPYFATAFENDEAFIAFAESMQSQSLYTKELTFTPEDRILTLSTCTNIRSDERFAVHARLIYPKVEAEENEQL